MKNKTIDLTGILDTKVFVIKNKEYISNILSKSEIKLLTKTFNEFLNNGNK